MATSVTSSTFLSQYKDDYRDSDHYHRILFNNGRALQARELTQLQTIIQAEIARIGQYLFNEGAIFNASATISADTVKSTPYVVVQTLPDTPSILKGLKITGPNISGGNITAIVKAVVPAASSPDGRNYLMLTYLSGASTTATNTAANPKTFGTNETLTYRYGGTDYELKTQIVNTASSPVVGFGSMVEVPSYSTFVAGHMVFVEKQSLVIDPKNPTPTETIGFVLNQQIITANDDISLFDNSGATPNITSPGADRLKITMTLTKKSAVSASATFYPLYEMISGNVVAENKSDTISGELGTRIRNERKSITGDYVVRGALDQYQIDVVADSADPDYLVYRIGAGIAFVNGNKVERGEYKQRILKPRDTVNDITTKTNEFPSVSYGNYFLAEDDAEGIVRQIATHGLVDLKTSAGYGGSTIGSARVRAMDKYGSYYRIHLFDVDMDSNGAGVEYNIGSTRSIGTSATNDWADIVPIEGEYRLVDRGMNAALFPLPGGRVYDVDGTSVSGAVSVIRSGTASSGSATFTVTAPSVFVDPEQWIVQVDATGQLVNSPTITSGGSGYSTVTVSGIPTDGACTLYGYEQRTLIRKAKSLVENYSDTGITVSAGEFALSKADIYKWRSVLDDVTGEDVSYKFNLTNGQTDAYYDVGRGKLRRGQTQTNTISVTYDYFSHSAGDYFCGQSSYPNVSYENIPRYKTQSGASYHLASVIDMRSLKNTSGTFSGGGAYVEPIPRNGDVLTVGTVNYWQSRVDVVSLSPNGRITVTRGDTNEIASAPTNIPTQDLVLHQIKLNPYTMSATDLTVKSADLRGYKMADIRKLDNRIERLEAFTTLNAAEIRNLKVAVGDPSGGADRQNLGLTADTFKTNLQSYVTDNDFRASVGMSTLTSKQTKKQLDLVFDPDASVGVVRKGSTLWPEYTEEVMIELVTASGYEPLNEFDYSRTVGVGKIYPAVDTWTSRKLVSGVGTGGANAQTTDQAIIDNWSADMGSTQSMVDLYSAIRNKN